MGIVSKFTRGVLDLTEVTVLVVADTVRVPGNLAIGEPIFSQTKHKIEEIESRELLLQKIKKKIEQE